MVIEGLPPKGSLNKPRMSLDVFMREVNIYPAGLAVACDPECIGIKSSKFKK